MRCSDEKGLTLIEIVIAVALMGIIAAGTTALVSSYLSTHAYATAKSSLYREGLMAMERMTDSVRRCTYLAIPNAHAPNRDILAVSGFINDDNDFYFGDPLFPRIDEDSGNNMNNDGMPGISGRDDDGDSSIDEGGALNSYNDDEDDLTDEEFQDGLDNDGDGNIDEDLGIGFNMDFAPGIKGMDDDGDGTVDEGSYLSDDDEDGQDSEDPFNEVIFFIQNGTNDLKEEIPSAGSSIVLSEHVTSFQVTYEAPERILITMTLTGDDGDTVTFTEYVHPRNTYQKIGKRVQ
jgi:prepilin-type N-terminal cleavage/methylation domain-containing protein